MSKTAINSNLQHLVLDCDISTNSAFSNAQALNTDAYKYGDKKAIQQFNQLTDVVLNKIKSILTNK